MSEKTSEVSEKKSQVSEKIHQVTDEDNKFEQYFKENIEKDPAIYLKINGNLIGFYKIKEKLGDSKYYYHGQFTINYKSEIKGSVKQKTENYNNHIVHIITKLGDGFNKSLIIVSDEKFNGITK